MKFHQYLLAIMAMILCLANILDYGGSLYASFRGQDFYYLYSNISQWEFDLYYFFAASISVVTVIYLLIYLKNKKTIKLTNTLLVFVFFMAVVTLCEFYIHSRYVGVG